MMRKSIFLFLAACTLAIVGVSCGSEDTTWDKYEKWRNENEAWLMEQQSLKNADGTPFYEVRVAPWNPKAYVLMHYFNDRALTEGNLSPLFNSTVSMKYRGTLYNGVAFDSTYTRVDSILNFSPQSVVDGFAIAMTDMRVGDSCRVVIPYQQGYGNSLTTTGIPPYSTLVFDMKMVDIVDYEVRP